MRDFLNPRVSGGMRWLHLHLLAVALIALGLANAGLGVVVVRQHFHGGYAPAREQRTAPLHVGGAATPASHFLSAYIVRLHNQGASYSCVAQTVATLVEIETRERGYTVPMSSGFIWNQINGGQDRSTTYTDAFAVLQRSGNAPLSAFWPDGNGYAWIYPAQSAFLAALPYRAATWRFVGASDFATIRYEIARGRPIAYAAPWYSNWVQLGTATELPYPGYGWFEFWHSVTIYGYDASGVWILNSWPGWGWMQRAHLSWANLSVTAGMGAIMAVADLGLKHKPTPKPKPKHRLPWQESIRKAHPRLGRYKHGTWHPAKHRRGSGYMAYVYQHGEAIAWKRWHRYRVILHPKHRS